ncbi:MAG TPA: pyridoxamine 5'-phosphate oxidase family protein, partial [Actinomycetota bacterium]|nr:pyridoxamine 5'-phosphate oxidase family protein [Actinomycetota bacterium]
MAAIPDPARPLLESNALAHLVTINPDGSPQLSCVWVGVDGDELVVASLTQRQK